jgi:hypothetical protein
LFHAAKETIQVQPEQRPAFQRSPRTAARREPFPLIARVWLANCYFASLARPKMPSGANAFEISDIQEEETEV